MSIADMEKEVMKGDVPFSNTMGPFPNAVSDDNDVSMNSNQPFVSSLPPVSKKKQKNKVGIINLSE